MGMLEIDKNHMTSITKRDTLEANKEEKDFHIAYKFVDPANFNDELSADVASLKAYHRVWDLNTKMTDGNPQSYDMVPTEATPCQFDVKDSEDNWYKEFELKQMNLMEL